MENELEPNDFDRETIDSLRLDTQAVSPQEKEGFNQTIRECHAAFMDEFGKFIDHPLSDQEVADRFILTDESTYLNFRSQFAEKESGSFPFINRLTKGKQVMTTFSEGLVIGYLPDAFQETTLSTKRRMVAEKGEEARAFLNDLVIRWTVVHEIAHLYQRNDLPSNFREMEAYWVCDQVTKNQLGKIVSTPLSTGYTIFFQQQISKYGNHLLAIFFGQSSDPELVKKIDHDYRGYKRPFRNAIDFFKGLRIKKKS